MVFLDTNTVIYLIEQPPDLGDKAKTRVAALLALGDRLAVSDLVRMECQVGPLKANDLIVLASYARFFQSPDLNVLAVSPAVCDREREFGRNTDSSRWTRFTWPRQLSMAAPDF